MARAMPPASFLDLLAARLNPDKIGSRSMTLAVDISDSDFKSLVTLNNAVLVNETGRTVSAPTVSVSGSKMQMIKLFLLKLPLEKIEAEGLKVTGDRAALIALQDAIETPPPDFAIVTL